MGVSRTDSRTLKGKDYSGSSVNNDVHSVEKGIYTISPPLYRASINGKTISHSIRNTFIADNSNQRSNRNNINELKYEDYRELKKVELVVEKPQKY